MAYQIQIDRRAEAELAALPKKARRRIDRRILALRTDPRPANARLLKGDPLRGLWRLRSGDYRIIYRIDDDVLIVLIVKIGDRKDIYRNL